MECIVVMVLAVLGLGTVLAWLRWSRASVLSSLADEHEGWTFDGRGLRGPVGDGVVELGVSGADVSRAPAPSCRPHWPSPPSWRCSWSLRGVGSCRGSVTA